MLRVRFKANHDDYRPVNWPVKHPYWCSGYGDDYSIVISYADNTDYIYENWPEAKDLDSEEVEGYTFTDRFPKPEWFDEIKTYCNICERRLNNPEDPTTKDCGGDCLKCMAEVAEDPDCIIELNKLRRSDDKN